MPTCQHDSHHLLQGSRLISIILSLGALGSVLEVVKHMSNALANNSLLYKVCTWPGWTKQHFARAVRQPPSDTAFGAPYVRFSTCRPCHVGKADVQSDTSGELLFKAPDLTFF